MVTRMWQSFRKTGDAENSVARVESQTLINPIGKIGSQNWRKIQNLTIFHHLVNLEKNIIKLSNPTLKTVVLANCMLCFRPVSDMVKL